MGGFRKDIRYGVRILRKDLGFSIVAALTLALGIGANTAIFSLVNGVLLRPLPYPQPGQLVRVFTVTRTQPHFPMAIADFYDYRETTKVFTSSALYAERDLDLTTNDRWRIVRQLLTESFLLAAFGCVFGIKNLATRLQALPGVQFAGFGSDIPWTGYDENSSFDIVGRPSDTNHSLEARYHFASPDYFAAAGIPLLSGRFFALTDDAKSPKVVIVNSAFGRAFFPGEEAHGQRLELWGFKGVQIVGVIGDVKDSPDAAATKPAFYWDDWQFAGRDNPKIGVIRADSSLASLSSAIRQQVSELDKDLPVTDMRPMDEVSAHAVSTAKFTWMLDAVFAGLAMLLAAIGIFGVMSYVVTQRTHEIGIRISLGAQKENVLGMVVGQGSQIAVTGVAVGFVAALVLTRAMRNLLYGVSASDPWTFFAVSGLLILVALMACYVPARRASKTDPIEALRYE